MSLTRSRKNNKKPTSDLSDIDNEFVLDTDALLMQAAEDSEQDDEGNTGSGQQQDKEADQQSDAARLDDQRHHEAEAQRLQDEREHQELEDGRRRDAEARRQREEDERQIMEDLHRHDTQRDQQEEVQRPAAADNDLPPSPPPRRLGHGKPKSIAPPEESELSSMDEELPPATVVPQKRTRNISQPSKVRAKRQKNV